SNASAFVSSYLTVCPLTDPDAIASLESPSMTDALLVAVIALLALVVVGLVAMALLLRRRARVPAPPAEAPRPAPAPAAPQPTPGPARPPARPAMARGGGGGGLAMAATTTSSSVMVCPTCRTEYRGLTYCTRDARRLVPPEDMLGGAGVSPLRALSRSAGLVC